MEVQVTGLESDGVALISPLSPEFDSRVDALSAPGIADIVRDARPYVVILSNETPRKIVAFTMSLSNFEGTAMPNPLFGGYPGSAITNQIFVAPDAVGASGLDFGRHSESGIPPNGQKLIGLGFAVPATRPKFEPEPDAPEWDDDRMWNWVVSTTKDFVARIKSQGAGTAGITVKLDAVIFDDGLLIGTETNDFLRRELEGKVNARQGLYQQLLASTDPGALLEKLFAPLRSGPPDFNDLFGAEAIGTANDLRGKYGSDKLRQVFQQAILKEPFVIHRK